MANKIFVNEICDHSIKKIAQGDFSELSVLYDCVGRLLLSVAFSILGDYQLSEDAMHETFLKIAEKANTYRNGSNAKAWIASICRNISLNMLEKRKHELLTEENANETDDDLTEDIVVMSVTLSDALALLTVQEKEIVVYKTIWKLKHKQIAQIMNLSVDNSRQKYKRALEKLRFYYRDEGRNTNVSRQTNTNQI